MPLGLSGVERGGDPPPPLTGMRERERVATVSNSRFTATDVSDVFSDKDVYVVSTLYSPSCHVLTVLLQLLLLLLLL